MDEQLYHDFLGVERSHWWFLARREILFDLVRRFVPPGSSFLDIGSGTGFFLERLLTEYRAFGLDASETAVRMCHERGLDTVICGTIRDPRVAERSPFDAAGYFDVIEHLDDDVGALRDARDLLRPGGVVIVTVPAYMFLWSEHDVKNHHRRRYTAPRLRAVLEEAGFRVELLTYFNTLLFPLAVARRLGTRVLRAPIDNEFAPMHPAVNEAFRRVFAIERRFVPRCGRVGMPFGLSIAAVGRAAI